MPPIKLFISTPCYNATMTLQYTTSLLKLIQTMHGNNISYVVDFLGNESLIPRARNRSLEKFLISDCTHMLFIDSDIAFEPEAVLDILKYDKDIVGCLCPRKDISINRLLWSLQNETKSIENPESRILEFVYNPYKTSDNKTIVDGDYTRVNHIGTGFMLVKRSIITKLCEIHTELIITNGELPGNQYALFDCMIKDKSYLSEDYSFCQRVNDAGGEIWANTKHNLKHIGYYSFSSDLKNRHTLT
tara:strand:+ start:367 stop:1101 length:735 start_codon:yes stop_codon:yes gene_type:complete